MLCIDPQTLRGSFSAVSRPMFASKYHFAAFLISTSLHMFGPFEAQNDTKKSLIFHFAGTFASVSNNHVKLVVFFRADFDAHLSEMNFTEFVEIS